MGENKDFKVKLGDPVQLQYIPDDGRERMNARVIGHSPQQSLIISAPRTPGGKLPLIRENQHFVVRMLQGSNVYGFETEVLKYYSQPYPHLHLRHPENIEHSVVRSAQRIELSQALEVRKFGDTEFMEGIICNTSETGALIETSAPLGELEDNIYLRTQLTINQITRPLKLVAKIRNVSRLRFEDNPGEQYRYGVQFIDLNEDQQILLAAFVNRLIVSQLAD